MSQRFFVVRGLEINSNTPTGARGNQLSSHEDSRTRSLTGTAASSSDHKLKSLRLSKILKWFANTAAIAKFTITNTFMCVFNEMRQMTKTYE